jgi:hypothetical protein
MDALRGLVTSGQTARDEFPELMLGERGPLLGRVIWLIIVGAAIAGHSGSPQPRHA